MPFAASIALSDFDGIIGSRLGHDFAARRVAGVGDIDGDGFNDVAYGDPSAFGVYQNTGNTFVVLGDGDGFPAEMPAYSVYPPTGFRIYGSYPFEGAGVSLEAAGDLNGDGFADMLFGATGFGYTYMYGDPGPQGAAYLVLGGPDIGDSDFFFGNPDPERVVRFEGLDDEAAGGATAGIGDFNGDGLDDFAFGASIADNAGKVYLVFGRTDLATRPDQVGGNFQVTGGPFQGALGVSLAGAGDLNGDGLSEVIIGAYGTDYGGPNRGSVYVVFGHAPGGFSLDVGDLDGTNGFRIDGDIDTQRAGGAVAGGGDINGDGHLDIVIGSRTGAYVVFGRAGGYAPVYSLADLDGTNGFRITSAGADDLGATVEIVDINGDGYDDVAVGAPLADTDGHTNNGAVYVVLGRPTAFGASVDVASLDGLNGFRLTGNPVVGGAGSAIAASPDLNGDGIEELIIGQQYAHIFYGQEGNFSQSGGAALDTISGGVGNDELHGLGGGDRLYGLGGEDDLFGEDGNDTLDGGDGDDLLDGGLGADKLYGGGGADTETGGAGADRLEGGAGDDSLTGGGENDYLDGGTGADLMTGGTGNDVYIIDDLGDQVVELAGEGYDIVRTALGGLILAANVEALQLQGPADIDGTGNAMANSLQGNAGANLLAGGEGADTLNGNDGDDTIVGGLGNDLLRGGAGADGFVLAHAFGPALETDQVYDFSTADGDTINLSGIDAIAGGADDAFVLVGAFSKAAGQMTLSFAGGITTLKLDVNGDGKADYQMKINGDVTGDSAGWAL